MRKTFPIMLFLFLFMNTPGWAYLFRYDGPYKGKIIDADTGNPIEGVVVLGVWNHETPTAAGAVTSFYDAQETVTDKNGEFVIKGLGLKIFSDVIPMDVQIFKTGYEYIGLAPWVGFTYWDKIKWEGKKAIIPLKKLMMEERESQGSPSVPPTNAPLKKIILMLKEINRDRIERGAGAIDIWRGEKVYEKNNNR